jgi:type IV secretory pathway VirB6-like protein
MQKHFIAIVAASTVLSFSAFADDEAIKEEMYAGAHHEQSHEPQHIGDKARHNKGSRGFAKADTDKDGTLTKKEAKKLRHVSEHFDEIDADKDGTVDRDEIHAYMANKHH